MIRSGVLSDESILKHCAIYNPIPMKMANSVLRQDLNVHKESPFTTKKLKYPNAVSRPASFNTLASSLTRIGGGNTQIRELLDDSYLKEIHKNVNVNENSHSDENLVAAPHPKV